MILAKRKLVRHLTHTLHMSDSNKKKATEADKIESNRAKHLLTISFLGSSDLEIRLIKHLKHVKQKTGVEIKAQILRAALTLNDLYAVGDNPESTRAEFEDAMANFLIELTSHLSRGLSYGKNHKYNVESPPNGWKQFCLIADSIFSTGSIELKNNGGSDDLDRSSKIVPIIDDLSKSQGLTEDEDEEQDEDEYGGMNDEEYLAATADRVTIPIIRN